MMNASHSSQFRNAIQSIGMEPPPQIEPGRMYRFPGIGKRNGNSSGWCKMFDDGVGGVFGDWSSDLSETWQAMRDKPFTLEEAKAFKRRVDESRDQAEVERKTKSDLTASQSVLIWQNAELCLVHTYGVRKQIPMSPARRQSSNAAECKGWFWTTNDDGELIELDGELMLLPLYNIDGELRGIQAIDENGKKSLIKGLGKRGLFIPLTGGRIAENYSGRIYFGEGFSTAATIRKATGDPVVSTIDAGNLLHVARAWRNKFPCAEIIVGGDVDKSNTGQNKAIEAAGDVCGVAIFPPFSKEELEVDTPPSDWNDFAILNGIDAASTSIASLLISSRNIRESTVSSQLVPSEVSTKTDLPSSSLKRFDYAEGINEQVWADPQSLTTKIESEPYPLDALPDTLCAAVEEVQAFVQAPMAMVATSAISALSLAIQPHFDVQRAERLHSPVSLFTTIIASSGERKSTCDGFFAQAIRDYEAAQMEAAKPYVKDYNSALGAWEAKRAGIKDKIRQSAKGNKPTIGLEADLCDLEHHKPKEPRTPRILYGDITPEELAFKLAMKWPSGGVQSAEAGIVFGSHGMSGDSVMRNLARLNQLWDGNDLQIDRRSSESFTVHGARLSMGLQVQVETLLAFFDKSGALARGTGFLARFLIAWPESTQGSRPFSEPPKYWPNLDVFNRRISELLNQSVPIDGNGSLTPLMLTLTPEAKKQWVKYHNAIEVELAAGGELYDVRDVASKSADNAARLAALFHVFEGGQGAIGIESFDRASRVAAWHLNESRRFFGELALPPEMADASRLDRWLVEHCRREHTHYVSRRDTQRQGTIRDGARLDVAISELVSLDRIQLRKEGKQLAIWLNPALLSGVAS